MNIKIRSILSLLYKLLKKMPFVMIFTLVTPFISGILTVYIYKAQVSLINIVGNSSNYKSLNEILKLSIMPICIYISITLIQLLLNMIKNISLEKFNGKVTDYFQSEIIDICNYIDYEKFSDAEFCNKLYRAQSVFGDDLVIIINSLIYSISIASSLLSLILLSATCGYYVITLVITAMIVVNLTIKLKVEIKVKKLGRELTLDGRIGDYLSKQLKTSTMLRELRIYNCIDYFINLWGTKIKNQHKVRYTARRSEIKTGFCVIFIQTTTILFILLFLIKKMEHSSQITVGLIAILFLGLIQCNYKIMSLTWPLSKLYVKGVKLYDLNEILKLKDYMDIKTSKTSNVTPVPIEINNLCFSYPENSKQILSNVNLTIRKNEKIAIVGGNGEGKSTLMKLLLGSYKPVSGQILWGNSKETPSNISIVYQNFIKYELTLRENIGLGNLELMNDDEAIINVLTQCGLYDLYKELGGLDVPLGHLVDNSRELSGGQWQRLAIARALFKNSDLIIFDEPTAAIDPNSELEIYNMLMEICKNKTAIFVSHRLGWAKNSDRIIVLDGGTVVEDGHHHELINKNGIYAKMYNLQASWYSDGQIAL